MMQAFSVSAYAVFGDKVLLGFHSRLRLWLPVGGKLEGDERPLEALQREVAEELGWRFQTDYTLPQLDAVSPPGFLTYEEHVVDNGKIHMNFAFVLKALHTNTRPSSEFLEMAWVDAPWDYDCPKNVCHLVSRVLSLW